MFFDALYYRFFTYFRRYEKGAQSSAAGFIGLVISLNFLLMVMLVNHYLLRDWVPIKSSSIVVFIVLQILTYIRYFHWEKYALPEVEKRWLAKSEKHKNRIIILHNFYLFVTFIGTIFFAIYSGPK
jgi:hypothetical protein